MTSRHITANQVHDYAMWLQSFAPGAFAASGVQRLGTGSARYFEGISMVNWDGAKGGRARYAAYMVGFASEWARLTGQDISGEFTKLGLDLMFKIPARWANKARVDNEAGRLVANERFRSRQTLHLVNKSNSLEFTAVLHKDDEGGRMALGLWTVEIFDNRFPHTEFGQFTGGSAYVTTLLGVDGYGGGLTDRGWNLDDGVADWSLDGEVAMRLRRWLVTEARKTGFTGLDS